MSVSTEWVFLSDFGELMDHGGVCKTYDPELPLYKEKSESPYHGLPVSYNPSLPFNHVLYTPIC